MTKVPDNIHDLIEKWHALPDADRQPLHEYLGLTWEEYKAWGAGLVSKGGTILTDEMCEDLATRAEAGYDLDAADAIEVGREGTIRKLQERDGVDRSLAEHVYDRQIRPQLLAAELRADGKGVGVAMVNTSADAPGHEVACAGCGRAARLPSAPPEGKFMLCPDCARKRTGIS